MEILDICERKKILYPPSLPGVACENDAICRHKEFFFRPPPPPPGFFWLTQRTNSSFEKFSWLVHEHFVHDPAFLISFGAEKEMPWFGNASHTLCAQRACWVTMFREGEVCVCVTHLGGYCFRQSHFAEGVAEEWLLQDRPLTGMQSSAA